jgi:predicted translin family RNA/ssDNA-binding protein
MMHSGKVKTNKEIVTRYSMYKILSKYPATYKKNIRQKYDCIRSQLLNRGRFKCVRLVNIK